MRLNLHDTIGIPGTRKTFSYSPDFSGLSFASVREIGTPSVSGEVRNEAGALTLTAVLTVDLSCVCARCLKEFTKHVSLPITAFLATEVQNEDKTDIFLLDGDNVDLNEIVNTAFVLNMDQKFLCSETCKGLCPKCGKNLNDGPCGCRPETDPRLAVLGQFLENE